MMRNKINLITGETYTLAELFSGTRRIIIPDLQRDYCWGDSKSSSNENSLSTPSYAEGFIDTLLKQFDQQPYGRLNLGLLYGYESPSDYVQLCDGQQRITTLFLLLGMLNRWAGDDRYRKYLMTDFEFYEGGHVPYLQYSVRESSLYFMSDLVYRFFTNGDDTAHLENVSSIYDSETGDSCGWFYGEYATDPSIISMLHCLKSIESKKNEIPHYADGSMKLEAIIEFLVDRLTFIYYDMGTRANGEETFVIINTTGEPLSATENLKPLVINAEINKSHVNQLFNVNGKDLSLAKAWEEMENYFWKNRRREDYDTADSGFKEFLRWVTLLQQFASNLPRFKQNAKEDFDWKFPYEEIPMTEIVEWFNVFVRLISNYGSYFNPDKIPGQGDKLEQKQLFVLLPLLAYLRKHSKEDRKQVDRLWKWLVNLTRVDNVGKAINDILADAISIGNSITDIVEIPGLSNISNTILTEEERFKLDLLRSCSDDDARIKLEEDIWEAQDMEVDVDGQSLFQGEISALLRWATPDCQLGHVARFDAAKFRYNLIALKRLFKVGDHTVNDKTRRALLATGYRGISWDRSYGWKGNWKNIIEEDVIGFRNFLNEVECRGLDNIIQHSHRQLNKIDKFIVEYPDLLAYCDAKNVYWAHSYRTWTLVKRSRAQPIPVALAAMMVRLGGKVELFTEQKCGYWKLILSDDELEITPIIQRPKDVDKIIVKVDENNGKLHYYIESHGSIRHKECPIESAEIPFRCLNLYSKRRGVQKHICCRNRRLTARLARRGRGK